MQPRAKDTMGVVKQTTWGTPVTTGHTSVHLAGDPSVTFNSGDFQSGRMRLSTAANLKRKGNYSYGISVPSELEASQGIFFIWNLLGHEVFAVDTPVAGANTHTITDTSTVADIDQILKKGFTAEYGEDVNFYTAEDCITTSVEIAELTQGIYPFNIEMMASDITEDTTSNVTFAADPTSQLFDTLQVSLSVGVNSSEVAQPITMTGLKIERAGIEPHYRASANVAKRWVQNGQLTAIGTFEIEVDDTEYTAVLDDFNNSDTASVLMVFTSSSFVTGTTAYALTFDMSTCKYTAKEGRTDGSLRFVKFTFEAGIDAGANIITVTAINDTATL